MTMNTKAATDDIYEMFNQPLKRHSSSNSLSENDQNDDNDHNENENEDEELIDVSDIVNE